MEVSSFGWATDTKPFCRQLGLGLVMDPFKQVSLVNELRPNPTMKFVINEWSLNRFMLKPFGGSVNMKPGDSYVIIHSINAPCWYPCLEGKKLTK